MGPQPYASRRGLAIRKLTVMHRTLRITGTTLIVLGLTVLQFVGYELYGTSLKTNARQAVLESDLAARLAAERFVEPDYGDEPPVTVLPSRGKGGWGRISIPKLKVEKVLVEGILREALMNGPGHYPATPLPGKRGTVGIAGHRTTWGAPFHNIDKLITGDLVVIQTEAGRYRYTVTGSEVVSPLAIRVLKGDPNSDAPHRLVLTTCTPKYSAAQRLVVYADLTSWQVAS